MGVRHAQGMRDKLKGFKKCASYYKHKNTGNMKKMKEDRLFKLERKFSLGESMNC